MATVDDYVGNDSQRVPNRVLGYVVYEAELDIPAPLDITFTVGFGTVVEENISQLHLGVQVPEITAVMYHEENIGGGQIRYHHRKIPFMTHDGNGDINEACYVDVSYDASIKTIPVDNTQFVKFFYFNRSSNSGGQKIYLKIKGTDALPQES